MNVTGKISIDCARCGKNYEFLGEEVNFEKTEMRGDDQCYVWEKQYDCVKCGNPISIRYEVCISPDGKVTDKKVDVTGAKMQSDEFEFN
ncbi:MAG: hypothetical protein LUH22_03990 [Bacteroides sp.]|nr:hypothetical protein [Bacteroides sp.]